ncbi:unnamed protein product [Adineta ricciae]|uniref:RING-CH-type domain-containing protein n=1 Tax=Adineta ricciae TaxID=249248 RepID=A0A814DEL6_ADIRI|nr:unnamed protein product [Adineta ricciae]CAF1376994.1 unnamed protein product [Adineta ricciae]
MVHNESEREQFLQNDQIKQCRICLDTDNTDSLISPCLCSGSAAFVHRTCLDNWRSENIRGIGFKYCDICKFEYVIETVDDDLQAGKIRRLKYYFFVIRDITSIFLLTQLIILALTFVLKLIDKNSGDIKRQFPSWMSEFAMYYLTSFVLLLVLIGFIVFIITCYSLGRIDSYILNGFSLNSEKRLLACLMIFVVICAVIGVVVGVFYGIAILKKIMEHHTRKLWLRQEANKYIVKDFQERKSELEKYRMPMTASAIP